MKKPILIVAALLAISLFSNKVMAQAAAPAAATGDVVSTLTASGDYTAFSVALRAAGVSDAAEAAGPFTVFAVSNDVLSKTPSTRLDSLVKDPTKLAAVLKFHVLAGKYSKADIIKALTGTKDHKTTLKTIDGKDLTLSIVGGKLQIADDHGNTALVAVYDIPATNGVIHGVTAILAGK